MAFSATSANHESPYELTPGLSQKQINTGTWGANSNTCVITDSKIHPNSDVKVWVTGTTPQADFWAWTAGQGILTITSGSSENSALTLAYVVY